MGDEALKPLFSRRIGKEETIGVDTSQYKKAMAFGSLRFTKRASQSSIAVRTAKPLRQIRFRRCYYAVIAASYVFSAS
jgi:hypothetical protein